MPSFEFTSPEGKKYQVGAPEGATQAQAFEMLQKQLGAQPTEQPSIQQPQPVPPAQQPEQQGFLSRVGTGLKERVGTDMVEFGKAVLIAVRGGQGLDGL